MPCQQFPPGFLRRDKRHGFIAAGSDPDRADIGSPILDGRLAWCRKNEGRFASPFALQLRVAQTSASRARVIARSNRKRSSDCR